MITHFTAVLIFAACASTVFGITQRDEKQAMIKFGLLWFGGLVVGTIIASWVMYFIKH